MEKNNKTFYHLQIAKCGGTYINNIFVHSLFEIFKNNSINYIDGEYHLGWQDLENIYTLSCFRDPLKRTISHYAYYKNGGQGGKPLTDIPNFIKWVKQNEKLIANYQIKNFLYTKKNFHLNPFNPTNGMDPDFMSIEIDKNKAINRIKNTNILLKNSQLNEITSLKVMQKILDEFGLEQKSFINKNKNYDHNITNGSKEVYASLSNKDIEYVYNINSLDSEIYMSSSLFFNGGK
jgi:hypothetical protein